MKSTLLPSFLLILAGFVLAPTASAQLSAVRIRVEQVNKSDSEKFTKKQQRSLKIHVSNSAKEPAELIAKYVFFGREAKGHDIVKLDEGEKAVSVKALGTEMVETGAATATMEEEHPGGKGGKKVEASGYKFTGYGVQVFNGDKLVAEAYEPMSNKEQWSKATLAQPAPKK